MRERETARDSPVYGNTRCDVSFLFRKYASAGREERRFFFQGDDELFGVIHYPEGTPRGTGIVMCAPFLDEYMETQGFLVNYARSLASFGYPVLRFDYRGCGESDGEWEDYSIPEYLSDIRCAMDYLSGETGVRTIGLFGVSLGATLALMTLEREDRAAFAVVCNPVMRGDVYVRDILRLHIAEQMLKYLQVRTGMLELLDTIRSGGKVYVLGYAITTRNHEAIGNVSLLRNMEAIRKPVALFAFRNMIARNGDLREMVEMLRRNVPQSMVREVDGPVFWKQGPRLVRRIPELFELAPEWISSLELSGESVSGSPVPECGVPVR